MHGSVEAVCTGVIEPIVTEAKQGTTAIRKSAVDGAVRILTTHVEGDQIANTQSHGGPLKTVYAYATEDRAFWERELGRALPPGSLGENLALTGVDVSNARSGERWRVGDALLEVTSIRTPCWKLAWALEEPGIERRFQRAARPGAYLTVVEEGDVEAGDDVRVVRTREDHQITMRAIADAYHNDRRRRRDVLEEVDLLDPRVAAALTEMLGTR